MNVDGSLSVDIYETNKLNQNETIMLNHAFLGFKLLPFLSLHMIPFDSLIPTTNKYSLI